MGWGHKGGGIRVGRGGGRAGEGAQWGRLGGRRLLLGVLSVRSS